jgi:hypothetical protein
MPFTREQAFNALASWNPATVFLDSYASKALPEDLDIYFGTPDEFFIAPETQGVYTQEQIVPILDDGNFGSVTFHDAGAKRLIELDVESPLEPKATFLNWQQYLGGLMLRIGESVDDDDRLLLISKLVAFKHIDMLFEFWRVTNGYSSMEYYRARDTFLSNIPASH